ncbi:MAG: hypothetical protein PHO15_02185 [Eubacteriales bacterium]|nr:hypothetical protein [Eubacteriales bacterium]
MYRDHPDNILGVNTADNLFSSSSVTANADGSMIERQEYIQSQISALSGSLPGNYAWGVAPAGTNSTTVVVIAALAGYGDDFFNHEYYMQILKNANSATAAPEAEYRQITDYTSTTGAFTCTAFSAAIEASDICLIVHESTAMLGSDDGNNAYASTSVVANADGSLIERLEYLQSEMGAAAGASLSADVAAIKAQTDEIGSAVGASISADIAAVQTSVDTIDDFIDTEVADIKTSTDMIPAFIAGGGIGSGIARKTVTFSNTGADVDLFTVTGDVIVRLVAVCATNLASAAGCTIAVVANAVALIATTASTDIAAGEIWHDASPDSEVEATSVMAEFIISDGNDISIDVETAKQVDSGVLNFYCIWTALSANGAVVAA